MSRISSDLLQGRLLLPQCLPRFSKRIIVPMVMATLGRAGFFTSNRNAIRLRSVGPTSIISPRRKHHQHLRQNQRRDLRFGPCRADIPVRHGTDTSAFIHPRTRRNHRTARRRHGPSRSLHLRQLGAHPVGTNLCIHPAGRCRVAARRRSQAQRTSPGLETFDRRSHEGARHGCEPRRAQGTGAGTRLYRRTQWLGRDEQLAPQGFA